MVSCKRCKEEKEGLSKAPFPGALGEELLSSVCGECWKVWLAEQTLQMNEKRLSLVKPEHRDLMATMLRRFLCLDGGEAPAPTQPPEAEAP